MGLKLMAELGLDGSGFEAGMRKAESTVHHLGEGLKGFVVGAVGIYTIEQALAKTVETAEELVDASERLSIAPEQLQVLRQAAKDAHVEMSALATAFEKIDIARAKALDPLDQEGAKIKRAFASIGIDTKALQAQTAAQLFTGQMRNAALGANAENLAPVLREILGKSFGQLMPVLKTDFDELEQKMKSLGAIMDAETAVKLKHLGDELSLVSKIIASQLGPLLVKLVETLYAGILRLGGVIAESIAFVKGGFKEGQMTPDKALFAGAAGLSDWLRRHNPLENPEDKKLTSEEYLTRFAKQSGKVGFDASGAISAKDEATKEWEAKMAEFEAMLAKFAAEADKLENPTPADFINGIDTKKILKPSQENPSDSLTRVGNFLGGMGIADHIQQRKLSLLEQIARNTAQPHTIGEKAGFDFNPSGPTFSAVG